MDTNPLARPYRALTVGMVTLVSLAAFEAVAVTTAMPTVARALDGLALYALAFGGAFAASIIGMVVSGEQSDRRGPRRPLWTGVAFFAAGVLVAGLAPDMWTLVLGRFLQGYGGGLMSVALYVVVGHAYPAALHPRVFTWFAGAWVVPSIAGPFVAGLIVEHAGWRWVFLGVVLLTVPGVLMVRPALRELTTRQAPNRPAASRAWWAVGAAASAGLLHVGGQQTGVNALVLLGLAALGLVVCAPRLLPAGTLTARAGLPGIVVLRGLAASAFMLTDVFLPLMLSRERGFSPSTAGLTLTVGGLAWSFGSWYQGRWGQRIPPARRLSAGLGLIAVGVAGSALCVAATVPVWVCVVGWAVGGFGMGVSYPAMSALTLQLSAPEEQGSNSSALQLSEALFTTAVLAVGGSLFAALVTTSAPAAYLTGYGIAGVLALLGVVVAARRTPRLTSTLVEVGG
jgi:MFS family permease